MLLGAGMIILSAIISGGLLYSIIVSPGSWLYMATLSCGAASSLITGLLMLFDAARYKVRQDVKSIMNIKGGKRKSGSSEKETSADVQKQIKSLSQDCERLRPESMKGEKA